MKKIISLFMALAMELSLQLLDKSIPQRINTRRKQFADKREHPYAE